MYSQSTLLAICFAAWAFAMLVLGVVVGRRKLFASVDEDPGRSLGIPVLEDLLVMASFDVSSLPPPPDHHGWLHLIWSVLTSPATTVLVFALLIVAVSAADADDMIAHMNENSGLILSVGGLFTAAARAAIANSIGMTPRKNWDYLLTLADSPANAASRRSLLAAFVFAHYTSNVSKWDKAIDAWVAAVPGLTASSGAGVLGEVRALVKDVLVWKQQAAHPTGKFLAQRLLTCNPTMSAMAFRLARPLAERTKENFIKMKYAPAINFDTSLEPELVAAAELVAKTIIKKPFRRDFFDTIAKSNYYLPKKPTPAGTGFVTSAFSTAAVDSAILQNWLNE